VNPRKPTPLIVKYFMKKLFQPENNEPRIKRIKDEFLVRKPIIRLSIKVSIEKWENAKNISWEIPLSHD